MKNDNLKSRLEELQKQLEETTNNWKRALADYQNLEKRVAAEKEEVYKYANKDLILKLLPVLDSLEKLSDHLKDEGVNLTLKQFQDILSREGVKRIEALGKNFNPEEMECIEVQPGEENKVLKEARAGYKIEDKIIRPTQVIVGKKEIDKKAEEEAQEQLSKGDYM